MEIKPLIREVTKLNDRYKTKEQLIVELEEVRQRIAELDAFELVYKQVEETLSVSKKDLRYLFDLMLIGVTILGMKGVILYCNPAVYDKRRLCSW